MESFGKEGKKYWENFGNNINLIPRQYFDFVSPENYRQKLKNKPIKGKKFIDLGAGFPPPPEPLKEEQSPLSSDIQRIIEESGGKVVPVDVAPKALAGQKESGRLGVLGSGFELPFKDGSIDGGATVVNLLNASFEAKNRDESFINLTECANILKEIHRVIKKDGFIILSNYGYIKVKIDNIQILGPKEEAIITPEMIKKIAEDTGFQVEIIPLEQERLKLAHKIVIDSFPEGIKEKLICEYKGSGAFLLKKLVF